MAKLLFVIASPRGDESKSTQVANTYVATFRELNPGFDVDILDLWKENLPAFDGDKNAAKLKVLLGQDLNAAQKTHWDEVLEVADRFISADRYVFSAPMWNDGIPYRLKQFIDIVHQPGITYRLSPENGYSGLLQNKHATLVLTSGAYAGHFPSPNFGTDHQSTYLRSWLNLTGVSEVEEVLFQPTFLTADREGDFARAKSRAVELAKKHGRI
ncbi:FMN-dependent NADH-azoreductase [Dyella psychrodurans]|uniref:FMN dependent NADH:quinone oxidoreductase n=1 Tax=Dyella psychrodurans TaxID=1927960 RepID=A0A370XED6_9GAMM|nr:NAD(P)H-dependent oxidoreductase [Dyella psychrodurans]RDS86662.1 FMN-dependent NADH-azoreductase [Dyella psychrodurans]